MNCGSGIEREDRFCGQCGNSLARQFGRDDGEGRKRVLPDLRRVDIRPFVVRDRQVKVAWLFWPICAVIASMAIGFMTSWGTPRAFVWFVLMALASIAFKPANDLRRIRHARLWGATSLESNASGKLFITELGGECPLCGGELGLRSERGGFDDTGRRPFHTVVACKNHRDHHWPFNPLTLHPLRNERDAPEVHG